MVGVPRSGGCQLCRKRRVKCDQGRPGCGNCLKYGVRCPGFERGLKFVPGKHQIRPKGKQGDGECTGARGGYGQDGHNLTALVAAPRPNRGQYISTMVYTVRASISLSDATDFLCWIELGRLGARAVLDGAMCAVATHLVGKERADEAMVVHSRTIYGWSLAALRTSLGHATEWKSSETLCAAMLLCVFELFAGTASSDAWLRHARGLGTLIKQRGPAAHAEGWDASMLLAFRGILIMCDMFNQTSEPCFLSRPGWKPLIRDGGRHLIHPPHLPNRTIEIADGFFERLAELPAIVMPTYSLRQSRTMGTVQQPEPKKIAALAQRAINCRRLFDLWYQDFKALAGMPDEVPSRDQTSPFATVFQHRIAWMGSMHMGYWASILIFQEALAQCQWPGGYEEPREELVGNILRSVESVGSGTMGPHRVGFSVRVAYEFASSEHKRWIVALLDRFKGIYAAIDGATYHRPSKDTEAGQPC
ncbi:fungal zn(2)-Cys(6) binuclear cluster domain-containing protein [Hirsutella rhossiliensis]|uniref:Fungal zn(2)-Cys(6) binuclear cluster domain-containing protein n=1 Tax=Hirsutella rhossiliensis TaxID=111463 RepID=A0A9P8N516_9HYPO|nr:fungal zn(2)-Cys(6) binuclear cluster domain-containing protein [Hirsutella rhossiliensis]KAH0966742.1 fungal zn(2)-Cys(6) binuclear cluster domain-containing protein [Hirsutella rhossiliensis]